MRRKYWILNAIVVFIFTFSMGCQSAAPSIAPPMTAKWQPQMPSLDLTLGWSGERFHVPGPVIVPPELIAAGYSAWNGSFLPVHLRDGRIAKMYCLRVVGSEDLVVPVVEIYRPDGTLQTRQFNGPGPTPGPNEPLQWDIYGVDGKTVETHVACQMDAKSGRRNVQMIETYQNGALSGRYFANNDVITTETDGDPIHINIIHEVSAYARP